MKFKEWVYNKNIKGGVDLINQLLLSRGITDDEAIKEFLNPLEMNLTSPYVFTDMQKAVERIYFAIQNNQKILIYGDFDADGMTSTSVLYKTLTYIGADVSYFIPNRDKEGHGLNSTTLMALNAEYRPKLLITVDCGISNFDEVAKLNTFKIDTIITDHHEAKDEVPPALAIINPKAPNALSEKLPVRKITELTYLAGVGVAFKLCQALLEVNKQTDFVKELLPLVAVGTIADIVPLLGENRYFAKRGLELIPSHKGLNALLKGAGYDMSKDEITSDKVAFGIAPRLNASGRLDTVDTAMKLLLSDNPMEIQFAVQTLNELNSARQTLCADIFAEADSLWRKSGMKDPAVILCSKDWHGGIIGIVASHFVEKYNKPAFLMNYSEENKIYGCSARGVKGLNIFDIINENSEYFEKFGGHELAGGFSFSGEKYTFDEVKASLVNTIKEMLNGVELKPIIEVDLKPKLEDINVELCQKLKILEPFGAANPQPVFALENLSVIKKELIGKIEKIHLDLQCESQDGNYFRCLWWKAGNLPLQIGSKINVLFHPEINEFNGNVNVQLIVHDIHSDDIEYDKEEENLNELKIFDHRNKTDILPMVNDYIVTTKLETGVFAECKSTLEMLKPYKNITDKIFNRDNLKPLDAIMFFDYPADNILFSEIMEQTGAKIVHFMNSPSKKISENDVISIAMKMIKFAISNNDGLVEFYKFTSFLGISTEAMQILFSMLIKSGIIKISEQNEKSVKVSLGTETDYTKILHFEDYKTFSEILKSCKEFQNFLQNADVKDLANI